MTGGGPGIMEAANRGAKRPAEDQSAATSSFRLSKVPMLFGPFSDAEVFFVRKTLLIKYSYASLFFPAAPEPSTSSSKRSF